MKDSILDTIGSPLVRVQSPEGSDIAAKIESFNPGGSAKDRPALAMIQEAERTGELRPDGAVVEATSGNTGIGLAMVCAALGHDLTVVMPESKSVERRKLIKAYGANVELVDGDMERANDRAEEIAAETGAYRPQQFENSANPRAHYRTTGREILHQLEGREPEALVLPVGTGGTLSGVGKRLREAFPELEIVAVEPASSAVLSGERPGNDEFQGMGPGFISPNLDRTLIDDILTIDLDDAERECQRLAREEGILVGQSSGAASLAARQVAKRVSDPSATCPEPPTAMSDGGSDRCPLVLTVFWDSGERYLSAGTFERNTN